MASALDSLIATTGNASTWSGGVAPVKSVTDLSDHVDGGGNSSAGTNATSDSHATSVMYYMAAIILAALAILYALGAWGLRGVNL